MIVFVIAVLLTSGCRAVVMVTATPLPSPTATATPFSTPLPPVPTQEVYGTQDRPYRMVFVISEPTSSQLPDADALATFFNDQTGVVFTVEYVDTAAKALAELCGEIPTLAWVDGWTLAVGQVNRCSRTLLIYQRGSGATASQGYRADLIASTASNAKRIDQLAKETFCRLNNRDIETWLLPVITMNSVAGVDALHDLGDIRNLPDVASILREVVFNRCVGAVPSGSVNSYRDKVPGLADITGQIAVLATSPQLPYGGLAGSVRVPFDVAQRVANSMPRNLNRIKGFVDATGLVVPSANQFDQLEKVLAAAGIDLTQH